MISAKTLWQTNLITSNHLISGCARRYLKNSSPLRFLQASIPLTDVPTVIGEELRTSAFMTSFSSSFFSGTSSLATSSLATSSFAGMSSFLTSSLVSVWQPSFLTSSLVSVYRLSSMIFCLAASSATSLEISAYNLALLTSSKAFLTVSTTNALISSLFI